MPEIEFISNIIFESLKNYSEIEELYKEWKNARGSIKKEKEKTLREKIRNLSQNYPFYNFHFLYLESKNKEFRELVKEEIYINVFSKGAEQFDLLTNLGFSGISNVTSINKFPAFSFFIQLPFTLAKPYISRDDEEFYIHENPIKKDKVFKVPMVAPSSWKGNLRWVATKFLLDKIEHGLDKISYEQKEELIENRCQIIRLFGTEKEGIEDVESNKIEAHLDRLFGNELTKLFRKRVRQKGYVDKNGMGKGRLFFYPTFFDKIALEVINPHDRKTKAGKQPIYMESVPTDTKGIFSLLYIPFNLIGRVESVVKKEVLEDLKLVFSALKEMMLIYGFSAKKSSGFGVIEDNFEEDGQPAGKFLIKSETENFKDFNELDQVRRKVSKNLLET